MLSGFIFAQCGAVEGVRVEGKGFVHNALGSIHKLRRQEGGGGLAKCLCYFISLCSKLAYVGGRGSKIGKILPT